MAMLGLESEEEIERAGKIELRDLLAVYSIQRETGMSFIAIVEQFELGDKAA